MEPRYRLCCVVLAGLLVQSAASEAQKNYPEQLKELEARIKGLEAWRDQRSQDIPAGTILMWLGTGDIPKGWCLLDGSDAACGPDLSGLFVMGTAKDEKAGPGVSKDRRLSTGLAGGHLPLLYSDGGVVGGPGGGDRNPSGTTANVYYPLHAKQHRGPQLYRHYRVEDHEHPIEGQVPHYRVRLIKKK